MWEHASLDSDGFRVVIQEKVSDVGDNEFKNVSTLLYRGFPDVLTTKETDINVGIPRPKKNEKNNILTLMTSTEYNQ